LRIYNGELRIENLVWITTNNKLILNYKYFEKKGIFKKVFEVVQIRKYFSL